MFPVLLDLLIFFSYHERQTKCSAKSIPAFLIVLTLTGGVVLKFAVGYSGRSRRGGRGDRPPPRRLVRQD